ncbi:hypothetical protein AB0392_58115, partial [Nonomuraea angiospora]
MLDGISGRTLRMRVWRGTVEAGSSHKTIAEHEAIYNALAVGDAPLAQACAAVATFVLTNKATEQVRPPPSRCSTTSSPTRATYRGSLGRRAWRGRDRTPPSARARQGPGHTQAYQPFGRLEWRYADRPLDGYARRAPVDTGVTLPRPRTCAAAP